MIVFIGTDEVFVCASGETVALSVLCDGTADCSNGNDETSPICESIYNYILLLATAAIFCHVYIHNIICR